MPVPTVPLPVRRPSRSLLAGAAALLLAAGVGLVATAPASSAAVAPTADYQLQSTLTSSVGSPPALTRIGATSFVTGTVDGTSRKVLKYPVGGGLARPSALSSVSEQAYTIAVLYKPLTVSGGYHRVIDLHGLVGDPGVYELDGRLYAYPEGSSTAPVLSATAFNQVVLTRTSGKVVTAYVNGKKVVSFTDSSGDWLASSTLDFGKDNTSGGATGEETGGQFARIRLWKTPLSASDVAALDRLPTGDADVAVTYVDGPDPVQPGRLLSYTATVTDNGPGDATGVTVTLTVPGGTSVQGSSPSRGTCAAPAAGKVVCTVGSLPTGQRAQVLLVLTAPTSGTTISSTSTVASTSSDPSTGNNTASQSTTVG